VIDRLEANRLLAERLTDELVVTGLGNATFDLFHVRDRARNFYTWGAMGVGVSIGLGLALARPRDRVLVLEGDGALSMGLTGLISIGRHGPTNLTVVVWDNQRLGLTGGQESPTAVKTDLAGVARACGFAQASRVETLDALAAALDRAAAEPGPTLIQARVDGQTSGHKPPRRPAATTYRFMRAIGALAEDERMVWD
jgi:thiamine pyrophosphate-dependent acetolactate synthase large subunit-like protein